MTIDEFSKNLIERAVAELDEGMKQARANVGASTCWDGYKAKGTKKKNGREVPNCVKAGYEVEGEVELDEKKKQGLWDNIHAKRERGEPPAKKGEKGYPKTLNVEEKESEEKDEKDEGGKHKEYKHAKGKEEKGEKKTEKEMKEARDLPGNQERIDANKNGKIDAHDFALLRARKAKKSVKEMWEKAAQVAEGKKVEIEVMPEVDIPNDPEKETGKKAKKEKEMKKEEVDHLEEKKLSKAETAKKEKFVKGMKKKFGSFKSKYGERAKDVMYGTATSMAKKAA